MSDWEAPDHWSAEEKDLWDDFVDLDPELGRDDFAQIMFHESFFDLDMSPDQRDKFYAQLTEYLESGYDIDFRAEFDWEDYREWYAMQ